VHICITTRVWIVASLGLLLLGFAATDSLALPSGGTRAGTAGAPLCRGKAGRIRGGHIGFSFECEGEDVTGFEVQANRPLHFLYDPTYAFGCERRTSRSFSCEDIHSGAGSVGSGVAAVSEPFCHGGPRLVLRVTPALDFESRFRKAFTLRGPC
jgi:hypothetical protein